MKSLKDKIDDRRDEILFQIRNLRNDLIEEDNKAKEYEQSHWKYDPEYEREYREWYANGPACYWGDDFKMNLSDHIEEKAEFACGNWKKFGSFYWQGSEREDADNWGIFYTSNRDSDILDQSNSKVISKELEPFTGGDDPDVIEESHGHWAVGHVDGFSIRVYDVAGNITPAFKKWAELSIRLEAYPVLDEDDFSEMEYEATLENIESVGHRMVKDDAPEDWADQCFSWFLENNQVAMENYDGHGGYPSDDDMEECLDALGLLEEE